MVHQPQNMVNDQPARVADHCSVCMCIHAAVHVYCCHSVYCSDSEGGGGVDVDVCMLVCRAELQTDRCCTAPVRTPRSFTANVRRSASYRDYLQALGCCRFSRTHLSCWILADDPSCLLLCFMLRRSPSQLEPIETSSATSLARDVEMPDFP